MKGVVVEEKMFRGSSIKQTFTLDSTTFVLKNETTSLVQSRQENGMMLLEWNLPETNLSFEFAPLSQLSDTVNVPNDVLGQIQSFLIGVPPRGSGDPLSVRFKIFNESLQIEKRISFQEFLSIFQDLQEWMWNNNRIIFLDENMEEVQAQSRSASQWWVHALTKQLHPRVIEGAVAGTKRLRME